MTEKKFDFEERTALFGENVLRFLRKIPNNSINSPLVNQLAKSATSMGANYCEADDAKSKKDFKHKIEICKKDARETKHFLRLMKVIVPDKESDLNVLWNKA